MNCPNCGQRVPLGASGYCPNCGAALDAPSKPRLRVADVAAGVVVGLVILAACYACYAGIIVLRIDPNVKAALALLVTMAMLVSAFFILIKPPRPGWREGCLIAAALFPLGALAVCAYSLFAVRSH